jgi:hypothetical protein
MLVAVAVAVTWLYSRLPQITGALAFQLEVGELFQAAFKNGITE